MEKAVNAIMGLINEILGSDKNIEKQTIDKDGLQAEVYAGDGFFSMIISSRGKQPEEDGKKNHQALQEEIKCKSIRKEFHKYLETIDQNVFQEACRVLPKGRLKTLNTLVEDNITDSKAAAEAVKEVKNAVNKVIMDKVVKLKSQMTTVE